MVVKMKELLSCGGDTPKRLKKEDNIRKKRVSWKLGKNSSTRKKKRKERAQKMLAEVKLDPANELVKRMALINENLNDLYVDDFSRNTDVLSLWLDARARERKERAGTHSAEKGSRVGRGGDRALFPVPQGLKSKSVDRGV